MSLTVIPGPDILDLHNVCGSTIHMRWLRLVGSLKLWVYFAEYRLFYRASLRKRPIILRGLLIVATPYVSCSRKYFARRVCWAQDKLVSCTCDRILNVCFSIDMSACLCWNLTRKLFWIFSCVLCCSNGNGSMQLQCPGVMCLPSTRATSMAIAGRGCCRRIILFTRESRACCPARWLPTALCLCGLIAYTIPVFSNMKAGGRETWDTLAQKKRWCVCVYVYC